MDVKYRHKKTGVIATWDGGVYKVPNDVYIIPVTMVEHCNDWEKIEERMYLITSFRYMPTNANYYILHGNGKYCLSLLKSISEDLGVYKYSTLEELLEHRDMEIYSVKNESGIEFKIGDDVIFNKGINRFKITRFDFKTHDDNKMLAIGHGGCCGIHKLQHAIKPIFKTEDGFDYCNEDIQLWYIKPNTWEAMEIAAINYWCKEDCKRGDVLETPKNKWFKTQEAAETWIEDNKPKYSLRDIESVCPKTDNGVLFRVIKHDLKKLKK